MSTITQEQTASFGAGYSVRGATLRSRLAAWNERRKTIARVTRELNTYTERQLADLGLNRSDIPDVARGLITR
jgi:uncharacterized protein YjiS (DUF1127 family)